MVIIHVAMPPKKAPPKETSGKPRKTKKTNKEFMWSDDEVQLLQRLQMIIKQQKKQNAWIESLSRRNIRTYLSCLELLCKKTTQIFARISHKKADIKVIRFGKIELMARNTSIEF